MPKAKMTAKELKELNDQLGAKGAPRLTDDLVELEEFDFEFVFEPLVEFDWEHEGKLVGRYHPGNTYNCTRYPVHSALRKRAFEWARDGKIAVMPLGPSRRFVMSAP